MKKLLYFLFSLIFISIGTEYFSRKIMLLLIASFFLVLFHLRTTKISKKQVKYFVIYIIINFGVIASKLIYNKETSLVINTLFVIQLLFFALALILSYSRIEIKKSLLWIPSLFYLPHLIGLLIGEVDYSFGQYEELVFGGFHEDPNYLSPDLLFSFSSQLFLFFLYKEKVKRFFILVCIALTIYLILMTGSRSAIMSSALILLLSLPIISNVFKFKFSKVIFILLLSFMISSDFVLKNDRVSYLSDRFTQTQEGASLLQNERFEVWLLSYSTIVNGDLFHGYGEDNFLKSKFRFVSHNVILNAGIRYGSYTFFSHLFLVVIGLVFFAIKFLKGKYSYGMNIPTYIFILTFSSVFMLNSISVSYKYIYWFNLINLFCFGLYNLGPRNKNFV